MPYWEKLARSCADGIGFKLALLGIAVPGVSSLLLSSKVEQLPASWSSNYERLFRFISSLNDLYNYLYQVN